MKYRCVVTALWDRRERSLLCGRSHGGWDRGRDICGRFAFDAFEVNGRDIVRIRLARRNGSVGIFSAENDSVCEPDGIAGIGRAIHVVPRNLRFAGDPGDRYGVRVDRFRRALGAPAKLFSAPGHERKRHKRKQAKAAQTRRKMKGVSHSESRTVSRPQIRFVQDTVCQRKLVDGRGFEPPASSLRTRNNI